jgi:hypothetical protein
VIYTCAGVYFTLGVKKMRESGYQIEIYATMNVTFEDGSTNPSDGFFYLKSFQCEEGDEATKILSSFAERGGKDALSQSVVLADFWDGNIKFSWYKDDEDFDYWVVNVSGEVIVEPLNPPEDWYPDDGALSLVELEFRRDGDSPPKSFSSTNLIEGWVEDVTAVIQNEDGEWVVLEDEE